jgi:hypothetical protein
MTNFRRIATAVIVGATLMIGGMVAASPASASTHAGAKMYEEVGPFSSYDGCEISRRFDDRSTTGCIFQWDRSHPFGWYYGYDD